MNKEKIVENLKQRIKLVIEDRKREIEKGNQYSACFCEGMKSAYQDALLLVLEQ